MQKIVIPTLFTFFLFASFSLMTNAASRQIPAAKSATESFRIEGTVLDAAGAAVARAEIIVRSLASQREWHAETDASGGYSIQAVPAGQYILRISAAGFTSTEQRVSVDSENLVVNLRLSPATVRESVLVRAESYEEKSSSIGSRTDTPLVELPQAISIVNRQLLSDQRVITLDEALKNVAGVKAGGYYRDWDYYRIRGFDAAFTTYIDGLRGENGIGEEMAGLEQVEVIKGPSSALYGQAVLGGIVNLQSKRPRKDAFAEVQLTGGSFNFYESTLDAGGSLNKSRTLYGRLNGVFRPQKTYVDFEKGRRWYAAPALTWAVRPATSLTLLSRLQLDRRYVAFPLPAKGTVIPNRNGELPIELFVGEPSHPNDILEKRKQVGYQFTHRFNETFSMQQNMRLAVYTSRWNHLLYPSHLSEDERTLYRYPYNFDQKNNFFRIDTPVQAAFRTGSIRHQTVVGIDYYRYRTNWNGNSIDFSDPTAYLPIDVFNPVYGAVQWPATYLPAGFVKSTNQSTGVYFQDQLRPVERLTLTFSGRVDAARLRDDGQEANRNTAFSPRMGTTYQFLPGASIYFSYSESFLPQSGRIDNGTTQGAFVEPERGRQWETGLKSALLDGRLTATLALYRLFRRNVATANPTNPNFVVLTGEQRSQGIEFETSLHPLPGWNLSTAYAYIDAGVSQDTVIPVGTRMLNVPRNSYNLWNRYEFQRGWAAGLALGLGAQYFSSQSGDLLDSFRIPAYGLLDASIAYRRGRFRLQFNLNNVLNKRYFAGSYNDVYVLPGSPRTARVTTGWTF